MDPRVATDEPPGYSLEATSPDEEGNGWCCDVGTTAIAAVEFTAPCVDIDASGFIDGIEADKEDDSKSCSFTVEAIDDAIL